MGSNSGVGHSSRQIAEVPLTFITQPMFRGVDVGVIQTSVSVGPAECKTKPVSSLGGCRRTTS